MHKKISLFILAGVYFTLVFSSCNTEVDLYADYKDITIVYGLLDQSQDTNYIKITKAFTGPGNALEMSQIYDSSNYNYKLNAVLHEYQNRNIINTIALDTVTLFNRSEGVFYHPKQLYYYTTATLNPNSTYQLFIEKANGDTVSANTKIVDNVKLKSPYGSTINFISSSNGIVEWYRTNNAAYYEVNIVFHWKEIFADNTSDTVQRSMNWNLGSNANPTASGTTLALSYTPSQFFTRLEAALDLDRINTKRIIGDIDIYFYAAGEELYYYLNINSSTSGLQQETPEYSNIINGRGIFSSRNTSIKKLNLGSATQSSLMNRDWGFVTR